MKIPEKIFQPVAIVAFIVGWLFPSACLATAILTPPQPQVGGFGAGSAIYVQDPLLPAGGESVTDPGGLDAQSDLINVDYTSLSTAAASDLLCDSGFCGSGSASADLATGTLRLLADGGLTTIVQAGFRDTIMPLATGTEHFDITINGTDNFGDFFTHPLLYFSGGYGSLDGGALLPDSCFSGNVVNCTLGFDINLTQNVQTEFSLWMWTFANNSTSDFSHTVGLTASGVDFTSASGIFLTQTGGTGGTAAVPEPSSLLLLSSGLGLGLAFSRKLVAGK